MKKKIAVLISALLLFTMIPNQSLHAVYVSDIQSSRTGYSLAGIKVLGFTLHASGYTSAKSGKVTNHWHTSWAIFPNNLQNEKTWVERAGNHERAYGSFKIVVGFPTPWGVVGLGHNSHYVSIGF